MKELDDLPKSKICVLISGGLDSFVLLDWILARQHEVLPVYVSCGLNWEAEELRSVALILNVLKQPELNELAILDQPVADILSDHWSVTGDAVPSGEDKDEQTFLPGRNIMLLSKAAVFCSIKDIDTVAIGCLGNNPFPDASANFLTAFGALLAQGLGRSRPFTILEPFEAFKKAQVVRTGRHLPLNLSFSCLSPVENLHCGRCNKCAERQRAFHESAVPDLTNYQYAKSDAFEREKRLQS